MRSRKPFFSVQRPRQQLEGRLDTARRFAEGVGRCTPWYTTWTLFLSIFAASTRCCRLYAVQVRTNRAASPFSARSLVSQKMSQAWPVKENGTPDMREIGMAADVDTVAQCA